ncbi:UrcA family protein [uncultured Maricaulis sp.]|uniref:UrcA family protein n=1 Tax=uncultured Maricaulis sp. TaxID=174710 RepID=UPI0030D79146
MKRFYPALLASLTLAGILTLAAPVPAFAQASAATQAEIRFEPADLIEPARLDDLRARIEMAATEVCREQLLGDLLRPVMMKACISDATARAMDQLDAHRSAVVTLAAAEPVEPR